MKSLLRSFIINIAALYIASNIIPGMMYSGGIQTLIFATLVLAIMNLLIRPIINILLLPINLITLGAFRWLVNVFVLFLLIVVISNLNIEAFSFSGFEYQGFTVPDIEVSRFWSIVLSSLTISFTNAFLFWLAKEE